MNLSGLLILADIPPSDTPLADGGPGAALAIVALVAGIAIVVLVVRRRRRDRPSSTD